MEKLKLERRKTLDELAKMMPVIEKNEQQGYVGGGSGDPYSWNSANPDSTHCVAYALAALGGVNLNVAINYLDSCYGPNGVPAYAMDSVIRRFYPSAYSVARSSLATGPVGNTIIWYQNSDSTGHAVNGYWNNAGGELFYSDPQRKDYFDYIRSDSCVIYRIR